MAANEKYATRTTKANRPPRLLFARFILTMLTLAAIGGTFVVLANSTPGLAFGLLALSIGAGGVSAGLTANLETDATRAPSRTPKSKPLTPEQISTESKDLGNTARTGSARV